MGQHGVFEGADKDTIDPFSIIFSKLAKIRHTKVKSLLGKLVSAFKRIVRVVSMSKSPGLN